MAETEPDQVVEARVDDYIQEWGPDLLERRQNQPETLGHLKTAHFLICQVREQHEKTQQARALNALYGNIAPELQGKTKTELYALLPKPAEHVEGRVSLLRSLIGPSTEQFLLSPCINYGHSPSAEHRLNLILLVTFTFNVTYHDDGPGMLKAINDWMGHKHNLLHDMDPFEYLGEVDDISDSLWLGIAMNRMPGDEYRWATDERTAAALRQFQGLFDDMEASSKNFDFDAEP